MSRLALALAALAAFGAPCEGAAPSPEAAGVVLIVVDGTGVNALHYALSRYRLDGSPKLPNIRSFLEKACGSQVLTQASDGAVTDSAAAATAMSCGVKTKRRMVGVGPDGKRLECLEELVRRKGKALGLVTTTDIADATPAAFSVHVETRKDKEEVKRQQAALAPEILIGDARGLEKVARTSLESLSKDTDGFFLLFETEETDSAGHDNDLKAFLRALEELDPAVGVFLEFQAEHPKTSLFFVSDHDTGGLYFQGSDELKASYTTGGHTHAPVFLYGIGPGAAKQTALLDNTRIFGLLKEGLGLR